MSYGYPRTRLASALAFRINDPRGGASTAMWTTDQIDAAITAAIRMAEPVGYVSYIDRVYPNTRLYDPDGTELSPNVVQVLDVLRVESYLNGKRTVFKPYEWTFERSQDMFVTTIFPPASGETIRMHVRMLQHPDDSTLNIDETMLQEYALSVLFEQYVVFGSESTTQDHSEKAQAHSIRGDQIKNTLIAQQYPNAPAQALKAATQTRASGS